MSAARTHDDRQFLETRGERIVVACCLALLFAGLVAIIVASIATATAAAAAFVVVFLTLALYIVRFLSTASRPELLHPLDEQQCRVCGGPFRAVRVNQVYCGRACRDEAAAQRRNNRRGVRRRLDVLNAERKGGGGADNQADARGSRRAAP